MEGSAKGLLRRNRRIRQPGKSGEHHIDLDLSAFSAITDAVPSQVLELFWRGINQDIPCLDGVLLAITEEGHGAIISHRRYLGTANQCCARGAGCMEDGPGDGSHATDWDIPVSGSPTNHVIEKALIGIEVAIVVRRERPNQPVGQDHATHHIVGEARFDDFPHGPLDKVIPNIAPTLTGCKKRFGLGASDEGVGHSRKQGLG